VTYLCECNSRCARTFWIEDEQVLRYICDGDAALIADDCPAGPDPGALLVEAFDGFKVYRDAPRGVPS